MLLLIILVVVMTHVTYSVSDTEPSIVHTLMYLILLANPHEAGAIIILIL